MSPSKLPFLRISLQAALGLVLVTGMAVLILPTASAAQKAPKPWHVSPRKARKKNPVPANAQSIAAGKLVYKKECIACHGQTGRGHGKSSADLTTRPTDLTTISFASQKDGAIFEKISKGRKPMPGFKKLLSQSQRWNVVNYLRTFQKASKSKQVLPRIVPKYEAPKQVRQAISSLLKNYFQIARALGDNHLDQARSYAPQLIALSEKAEQIQLPKLPEARYQDWKKTLQAISRAARSLNQTPKGNMPGFRKAFQDLSHTMENAVSRFGHTLKHPLKQYQCTMTKNTWLMEIHTTQNPYNSSTHSSGIRLVKVYEATKTP